MSQQIQGIARQGLDAQFESDEARKSNLILEARWLAAHGEDAAEKFAQAAQIEADLARRSAACDLAEKSFVHQLSAASCWAQAGDFYHAVHLCDNLLAHTDLPERLRRRVQEYSAILRQRRHQWYAGVAEMAEAA